MKVFNVVFGLSMFCSAQLMAADWPIWLGPNSNSITSEEITPSDEIVWRKKIGAGYSSFTVMQDKLLTAGNADEKDFVYCMNPETGEAIWTYSIDSAKGKSFPGPRATPVTDGKSVWFITRHGDLVCLELDSGKEIWKSNILTKGTPNPNWQIASSVVIYKELAILNVGDSGVAVNKNSGETVWQSNGVSSYASPALLNVGGIDYVAFLSGKFVSVVEPLTGKVVAQEPWKQQGNISGATPVVIDGGKRILITSGYKTGRATLYEFNGKKLTEKWSVKHLNSQFSTPVYYNGVIYGSNGNNNSRKALRAVDINSGDLLWTGTLKFGSPMIAGKKLVYLDEFGTLSFLNIDKTKEDIIKSVSLFTDERPKAWQMPIVANGFVYCRDSLGNIVCVKVK